MFLFLKKKTEETPAAEHAASASHVPLHDFIPYHCHFNPHTLLTKNGELMQIIRITSNARGLNYETGDENANNPEPTIREAVRTAIAGSLYSDKLALSIHTIRKRRPVKSRGQYKEGFAAYAHEQWQKQHRFKYHYHNEVYLTVLHEGQPAMLVDSKHMQHVVIPWRNRQFRNAYLDAVYGELEEAVQKMLAAIAPHYQAERLSVVERMAPEHGVSQAIFYSEPMEFLGTLLNLKTDPFLLPEADISKALCTHQLTFGFNAIESKDEHGKRRFGAMLSLKHYREVPAETADRVLQAPIEFIISQSFRFIPHTKALAPYREQKKLFEISGDLPSIEITGIQDMLKSHKNQPTDFGEYQTTILVMSDDYKQLDPEVSDIQGAFGELGLITVREDIKLEECFWSQLPGNFEFLRRQHVINTARIGGFCRLNRFPSGNDTNNHWGDALTLLPTIVNSPYFFNFHHQDNGHTLLLDFDSFHDHAGAILLNFLLTESRKYQGRLFVFDRDQSAKLLFEKLGGEYHQFSGSDKALPLNPFSLPNEPRNLSFLLAWCAALISPDAPLSDNSKATLRAAIEQLYAGPEEARHLPGLVEQIAAMDAKLANAFSPWFGKGHLRGLVDATRETIHPAQLMHGFDMTPVAEHPEAIIPVFTYLLHRIICGLDGQPTLIVLHEAFDFLENSFFASRLDSLLEMLKQNNAMVVFTSRRPTDCTQLQSLGILMRQCATHIYVPDEVERFYASEALDLTAQDARLLQKMERQKGDFLLKQGGETIALKANTKPLDVLYATFANDSKNLIAAENKFLNPANKD